MVTVFTIIAVLQVLAGYVCAKGIYCITKKVQTLEESDSEYNDIETKVYYSIQTKIDIRMPIIDNWLSTKVFMVTGNTKAYDEKVVKDD